LAIARDLSADPEEARALEGLAQSHFQDGNSAKPPPILQQPLTIYQRTGAPGARRIQETLRRHELPSTTRSPIQWLESARPGGLSVVGRGA
jgi:hypothetical protein